MPIYMTWTKPGQKDPLVKGDVVIEGLEDWPDTADGEVKLDGYKEWIELSSAGSIALTRETGGGGASESASNDKEDKEFEDLKLLFEKAGRSASDRRAGNGGSDLAQRLQRQYGKTLQELQKEFGRLQSLRSAGQARHKGGSGASATDQNVQAAQPPTLAPVTVKKILDKSTTSLLDWAAKPASEDSEAFDVFIHVVRGVFGAASDFTANKGPSIHPSFKCRLMGCYVGGYQIDVSGSGEELPTEELKLVPNGVKITYYEFDELGKLQWSDAEKYTMKKVDASSSHEST